MRHSLRVVVHLTTQAHIATFAPRRNPPSKHGSRVAVPLRSIEQRDDRCHRLRLPDERASHERRIPGPRRRGRAMRHSTLIGCLLLSTIVAPLSAQEQTPDVSESRAATLAAERDQKATETSSPQRGKVERALYRYD